MKINMNDIHITDDLICSFIDGRTTPEQDLMIYAKMKTDKELACRIEDLSAAMDAVMELSEEEIAQFDLEFDKEETQRYVSAAFSDTNGMDPTAKDRSNPFATLADDDLADDFFSQFEEEEPDK